MVRTFYEMKLFTKKWQDLGFTDDELSQLQQVLLENPKAGDVMKGTGGLRKVRFAFPGSGKSPHRPDCCMLYTFYSFLQPEN